MQPVDSAINRQRADRGGSAASADRWQVDGVVSEVAADGVEVLGPGRLEVDQRGLAVAVVDMLQRGERDAHWSRRCALVVVADHFKATGRPAW
jgi:hypothetical protein